MDDALQMFILQSDIQFTYAPEIVQGLRTKGVSGEMTSERALDALLAGTPLFHRQEKPGAYTIDTRSVDAGTVPAPSDRKPSRESAGPMRGAANIDWLGDERGPSRARMIVTGTHLSDVPPIGPPTIRVDRSDIEKLGVSTIEEVMRTVPQNFEGGATEDTFRGLDAETNSARGSAPNLRGLGAGATLLLFAGRRLAPGGSEGSFSDVSNIPLLALEYIEILPNGASAVYGSEAVGGVVNLVPRRDYEGAESQARAGEVTSGGLDEYQFAQTLGVQWGDGGAFMALEYLERGALSADDRDLARSDLRRYGGDNFDTRNGNPGTILDGGVSYAIPRGQDGRSLTPADLTPETENLYDLRRRSDLLHDQKRLSVFATARHEPTDRFGVFADLLYARRNLSEIGTGVRASLPLPATNPFYVSPSGGPGPVFVAYSFERDLGRQIQDAQVDTANLAFGSEAEIGRSWRIKGHLGYAMEKQDQDTRGVVDFAAVAIALADPDPATAFNLLGDGSFNNLGTIESVRAFQRLTTDSELRSLNAAADGPLFELAGGKAMLAIGIELRDQSFESSNTMNGTVTRSALRSAFDRRIRSAFAELRVPLFGSLEISLAGRHENYSDFGDKAVPAFGLVWAPVDGLALRGSWSESYKAPNLADLDEKNNGSQIFPLVDPESPGAGPRPMLLWFGKNADLREETSTSWTVGMDVSPAALPGLKVGLTYFDINFKRRVQEIASAFPDLSDPRLAQFIDREVTAAEREIICSRSTFFGSAQDCLTSTIAASLDLRIQNIAINTTRGLDVLVKYEFESEWGEFDLGVVGTRLFEFSQDLSRSAPGLDLLDTQNNPLDLRLRGNLSWSHLGMGATLAVNYAGSYRDVASQPERRVGSWTTYDLQLRYDWDQQSGWLSDSAVSLTIQNLFDKDPPFLNNQLGIGYDQENADPAGRFIRLYFKKSW